MIFKKTALLVTAIIVAVAFTGCSKKPRRPNPMDTVMDGGAYNNNRRGGDEGFNPAAVGGDGAVLESRSMDGSSSWADQAQRGIYPTVYFAFDSASIAPQERSKLEDAAARLKSSSSARLVLEGHCDWRGTSEYNLALGDRRAKAVQQYLETLGISANRLQTLSKGDLGAPEGASAAQMTEDRRVELLVVE